jgi:mRNA-degrading endonuclease RelE of RelBE toxin-antitoxin system
LFIADVPNEWADGVLVRMHELGVPLESVESLQRMHSDVHIEEDDDNANYRGEEENVRNPEVGAEDVEHDVLNRSASHRAHLSRSNSYESSSSMKRSKSGYEKSEPYIYEKLMEGPYSYTLSEKEKKRILKKSKELNDDMHRPKTNQYLRSSKQQRMGKEGAQKGKSGASRPHTESPAKRAPEAFGAGARASSAAQSKGSRGRGRGTDGAAAGAGRPKLVPLKIPVGFEGVAEKIFHTETSNDIESAAEGTSDASSHEVMPRESGGARSPLKKLSYAEKLQVMIMHVQEKM